VHIALFAQRPYDIDVLASLREKGFPVHPQEVVSTEVVIIDRRHYFALDGGEPLPRNAALTVHLLALRDRELVVIRGRVRRGDDRAGILVLEGLGHLWFEVRCRLPIVRGQWVRVLAERPLSPFVPRYLPHTLQALEVRPLVRPAADRAAPAEALPLPVIKRWEALARDHGFMDLGDTAAYLQQHRIHPEEALHAVASGAPRFAVWALTVAAALALQQEIADPSAVKTELQRGLTELIEALPGATPSPGSLNQRLGLEPRALEAAMDAMALEIVAAVLDEPAPETGFSARTGA
jgi:hypothetical protein